MQPRDAARDRDVRMALDAIRRIVQALRLGARGGGLSAAQRFALQQIAAHPGASINDVAALTFTHQSTVSVVIQRLVARRLVAKVKAAHDRRQLQLAVTAAGVRALANASRRGKAAQPVQEQLVRALSRLSPSARLVLARSLADVARGVTPKHAATRPPMMFDEPRPRRRPAASRRKSR